jgi:dipeptidyl aminopeptidase/acylaminoacyl peptidase
MYELLSAHAPRRTIRPLVARSVRLATASLLLAAPVAAQQTRTIEPEDYYRIQHVGDSKLSPDGRYVLYTVQTVRRAEDDRITHIWFSDLKTGKTQRLSTAGVNSTGPNWTPDGKRIYFTTTRGTESGLHFLNFLEPGGEAYTIPGITSSPNYAPDGSWILVSRSVAPGEDPSTAPDAGGRGGGRGGRGGGAAAPAAPDSTLCWPSGTPALSGPSGPHGKTEAQRQCDVYVITHAVYKRDGTLSFLPTTAGGAAGGGGRGGRGGGGAGRGGAAPGGGRFTQFFRMSADGLAPGQQLVPITSDPTNKTFESFSSDGKWIVYTVGGGGGGRGAAPAPDEMATGAADAAPMPEVTIFRVAAAGGTPTEILKVRGTVAGARLSPNAKQIAFVLTEKRRGDPILRVADATTGKTIADIGKGWKYPIASPEWTPDGRDVTWVSGIGAGDQVVKAPATGGAIVLVTKPRQTLTSVTWDAQMKTMAYIKSTIETPAEAYVANADGTNERQISQVNTEWMKQVRLSRSERFTYQGVPNNREWLNQLKTKGVRYMLTHDAPSGDKPEIEAILMYPPDYQPGRKYPMVTFVHGGPHGRYTEGFSHEFQMVSAPGMFVLFTNPRGSTNYGNDFQYMTLNAWGIDDAKDILHAVDMVVARGLADPARLGVSGGSYGGFMTNWLTSQDQRWKAAVTDRSISNWMSFYGASDASSLVEGEFAGMPWPYQSSDTGSYVLATMLSPIVYADKVKTPTLIIHSLTDYRVPFEEGEQWYRALTKNHVPVKLVGFPDSSHGLSATGEPWLLVRRLHEYVNWFKAYLVDDKPVVTQTSSSGN